MDHEQYMRIALQEAERAGAEGNVPVGSVIVFGDTVVRGRNLVVTSQDVTAHAELVALRAASALGSVDWRAGVLYTSYEPCPMCCGAIVACGIGTVVLGARRVLGDPPWGDYTIERLLEMLRADSVRVVTGVLAEDGKSVRDTWEGAR